MNDPQFKIIPLFPSTVVAFFVSEDISKLNSIKDNYSFKKTNQIGSHDTYATSVKSILNDFPNEKNILVNYFNLYKNNILKLENTNFVLTTSWGTKTDINGYSQLHKHKNSVYSGILYFEDTDDIKDGGMIEFYSPNTFLDQILVNDPTEFNQYNSTTWLIGPKKNMLLFFPSNLMHRVTTNTSSKIRYSLAFNFFPESSIGSGDSSINIEVI